MSIVAKAVQVVISIARAGMVLAQAAIREIATFATDPIGVVSQIHNEGGGEIAIAPLSVERRL
jgi:hypothetical protein